MLITHHHHRDFPYPWRYYLLDGRSQQFAVWNGQQTSDPTLCPARPLPPGSSIRFMYPTEYLTYGLGSNAEVVTAPDAVKTFKITDHLGSTRAEIKERGRTQHWDYEPYGKAVAGAPPRKGFIDREKDKESGLGDFGVRKYDDEIGRFLSPDPLWENYRAWSPYVYSRNNPVLRVDPTGKWDITVHAYNDRAKYGYGIAIVTDRSGNEVFRFKVRLEGSNHKYNRFNKRDRMRTYADTPLGTYDIPDGSNKWLTGKSRESYGPNPRLVLIPESGEIKESGRDDIRIHGGRQEYQDPKTGEWIPYEDPKLKPTYGCLRCYDKDIKTLKNITDQLEANDELEFGGKLKIVDDLIEQDENFVIP